LFNQATGLRWLTVVFRRLYTGITHFPKIVSSVVPFVSSCLTVVGRKHTANPGNAFLQPAHLIQFMYFCALKSRAMSDRFFRTGLEELFVMANRELSLRNSIFGIDESLFFRPSGTEAFRLPRFGQMLGTPIGVAAGPHTQLAVNIVTAWLCGARYMELKTIQTLDELEIAKPCIDMQDEGYNCEWSQELKIAESIDEYINAWVLIHVLHHKFGFPGAPEVIFNMSVGYNMDGMLQQNVQSFFNAMSDASLAIGEKKALLKDLYPAIDELDIPSCISDNVTLSTMHGCPPDEIEKIGMYLIGEKKLHTVVKLNPTLLGPEMLRNILNDILGFGTEVPDEAFGHDLKYPDALHIIRNLTDAAQKHGVHFGIKLTNTLECINKRKVFPETEKMMYMSGRALHPLSVHLAEKLQRDFHGALDISFSGGADCFNIADLVRCGLSPVTVCSDLLKPGGYARLAQYVEALTEACLQHACTSLDELVLKTSGLQDIAAARMKNLAVCAPETLKNSAYRKPEWISPDIRTKRALGIFDCIAAPCVDTCPSNQEIPQYMYHAARNETEAAMGVILQTNPFPNVCGMVCDHVCQTKCTRVNYDNTLLIREVKRYISDHAQTNSIAAPADDSGFSAAMIGAGPSGLACAYFLRMAGFRVTVYETKNMAGGMLSDAIPAFRLSPEAINRDIEQIVRLGVDIRYNHRIDAGAFEKLRRDHDFIYIAAGAQLARKAGIPGEELPGVLDPLAFLSDVRQGKTHAIGARIAVIGGGNTAMDVARTARRLSGEKGSVMILYRRTRSEMPAEPAEVEAAISDGAELVTLSAPVRIAQGEDGRLKLICQKMELGAIDESGRRKPVPVPGSEFEMEFDSIIPATGQEAFLDFTGTELQVDPASFETSIPGVFMGGDAFRGGATIIRAIGDGRKVANAILMNNQLKHGFAQQQHKECSYRELMVKRSKRVFGMRVQEQAVDFSSSFALVSRTLEKEEAVTEAERCLYCDELCNICVTVCPNRAMVAYHTELMSIPVYTIRQDDGKIKITRSGEVRTTQESQVANVGNFCNECGNCTTFCPTAGRPFADKPRLHLTAESFKNDDQGCFFSILPHKTVCIHKEGESIATLGKEGDIWKYEDEQVMFWMHGESYELSEVTFQTGSPTEYTTRRAAEMIVYDAGLREPFFS
jgi:putative selenate reductase